MNSIKANLNLGQDVARITDSSHIVASFYPLKQSAGMHRYGSLININPSANMQQVTTLMVINGSLSCYLTSATVRTSIFHAEPFHFCNTVRTRHESSKIHSA